MTGWPVELSSWTLKEYLQEYNTDDTFPRFQGYEPYRLLWEQDFMTPGITAVRVTFDSLIDECYVAHTPSIIEGLNLPPYAGPDGLHSAQEVLKDDVSWWAEGVYGSRPIHVMRRQAKPEPYRMPLQGLDF